MLKLNVMEVKRIACSCGHKFVVTKADAYKVESDFTGPDCYYYMCSKCGRTHLVSNFEFHEPSAVQRLLWGL